MHLAVTDAFDIAIHAWGDRQNWPEEQVLRLLMAAVAGSLVGLEREMRGRQAGFRTNLLVCVGSALVMLVSVNFAARTWTHNTSFNLNIDPARIAYGIMTGIGFLGAGTIIKHGATVRGLTTAASLWCVAAVGMAAGFGMYLITIISTVMVVAALWILGRIDNLLPKPHFRTIVLRRPWKPTAVEETVQRIKAAGMSCNGVSFDRTPDLAHADISVRISFADKQAYYALERDIEKDADYQLIASREE